MMLGSSITGIYEQSGPWKKHERPYNPPYLVGAKAFSQSRVKSRRKVHREFWRWFAKNRHRFLVDIKLERRFDEWFEFSFVGFNAAITGRFMGRHQEIEIWIKHQGETVDNLTNFYAWPKSLPGGGYYDESLLKEYQVWQPSRLKIWELGIYEDFLRWVNGTLAVAHWLEIQGEDGQWGGARLIMTEDYTPDVELGSGYYRLYLPCRSGSAPAVPLTPLP